MHRIFFIFLIVFSASTKASERELGNYLQYAAGIYGSIYIHEWGHAAVAYMGGATDIDIDVPRKDGSLLSGNTSYQIAEDKNSPAFKLSVDIAGLITANMAGELVIQKPGLHGNPFAQSIATTNCIANLKHVYTYYTHIRGRDGHIGNGIDAFEMDGGNPHILSALLVTYTLWSLKRMEEKSIPLYGLEYKF